MDSRTLTAEILRKWNGVHALWEGADMKKGADARTLTAEILGKLVAPGN